MPNTPSTGDVTRFRSAIDAFLQDRLQAKLDKLKPDDPQRPALIAQHQRVPWLESAARRVTQIQAVTHALKPVHPDARGTNLYADPTTLPTLDVVGSHVLGANFAMDVVGNAAALDVYKLLKLDVKGRTLLHALLDEEAEAIQALHDDPVVARQWRDALVGLAAEREGGLASHTRGKQLYWLAGTDASDDAHYHLLLPLHATSLAQVLYEEVQDVRFGELNKQARQAWRNSADHAVVYREYRDLAVQKLGGTKPQNVSQLNSERGGNNYLLSSLPPRWRGERNYLPAHAKSIFDRAFGAQPVVRETVRALLAFLLTDPPSNQRTRQRVEHFVSTLIDDMVIYAAELRHQAPGWSRDERFDDLVREEKLWLDPLRAELEGEADFAERWLQMDWPAEVGKNFGLWLNAQLKDKLPTVGYAESREWRKALLADENDWAQQLRALRKRMGAPGYIPFRGSGGELVEERGAQA